MKRICFILIITIWVLAFIGEIKCIVKVVACNWSPIGRAEVVYTIGMFTGLGAVIGYLDIEDN